MKNSKKRNLIIKLNRLVENIVHIGYILFLYFAPNSILQIILHKSSHCKWMYYYLQKDEYWPCFVDLSYVCMSTAISVVQFPNKLHHYKSYSACTTLIYMQGLTLLFVMGLRALEAR